MAIDMLQGARVGVATLAEDLLMAGGGSHAGSLRGPLGDYFAPILPYRIGNLNPDPLGQFLVDRITLMYVPATAARRPGHRGASQNNPGSGVLVVHAEAFGSRATQKVVEATVARSWAAQPPGGVRIESWRELR